MTQLLDGKVALVTGASSGIGEAIALGLAEAGATVAVSARRADRLKGLVERIEQIGAKGLALAGDMAVEAEAVKAVDDTVAAYGRIDILINSAGIMEPGPVTGCDFATYRRVFDINMFGALYTSAAAIPHMLKQGVGDIVTISSLAGRKGGPMTSAYSASKHAVNSFTDGLRQELGEKNIRVSTLMPGATTTEVADAISDPKWRKMLQAHVAKEGAVSPKDIADTIVFMMALPRRANISEISVRPTIDVTA